MVHNLTHNIMTPFMSLLIKSLLGENRKISDCIYGFKFLKNANNRLIQQTHLFLILYSYTGKRRLRIRLRLNRLSVGVYTLFL